MPFSFEISLENVHEHTYNENSLRFITLIQKS